MATVKVAWILLALLLVECGDNYVSGIITDVRLVGGPSPDKGTVQIMQDNGTWETACGLTLDIKDVIVICKQLGYTAANRAIHSTPYGQDSTPPIWLRCDGADKGGAIVLWKRDLYVEEGLRQLSDTTFYEEVDHDPTDDHQLDVKETVTSLIDSQKLPKEAKHLL
nr:scavenger receptor cysteine-rich domain superfamily protein-like [Lytechinus pictus]